MDELVRLEQNIAGYNKRFYLARMVSGSLITVALVSGLFLAFVILEHFLRLGSISRAILFYGFGVVSVGLVVLQIVIPLLRYFRLIVAKSETEAAQEIGRHIPFIEDKLSNALSLKALSNSQTDALISAGLQKKSSELNRFDFSKAIDFKSSLTWLKYTLIPLIIIFITSLFNPALIKDSTQRLLNYNESFIPPAPFEFVLQNEALSVPEGEDFKLEISTIGNAIPENCFVLIDGQEYRMKREGAGAFSYTFSNVVSNSRFSLRGASVYSDEYVIESLEKPQLLRTEAYLAFPAYTKLTNASVINKTNLKVPEGTRVQWKLDLKNAEDPAVFVDTNLIKAETDGSVLRFDHMFYRQGRLKVFMRSQAGLADSAMIAVSVTKDEYPSIAVTERVDSVSGVHYFAGQISDDYGFEGLRFKAFLNGELRASQTLPFSNDILEQRIAHAWQPDSLIQNSGDKLEYYFEVFDNDAVNGSKSNKSNVWKHKVPDIEELRSKRDEQSKETKETLKKNAEELKNLDKELKDLKKDVLEKRKPDWQDQDRLKEMLKQQQKMMKELQNKAQEQKTFEKKNQKLNEYSEELIEKQKRIQEMFDELFDEEFKKKYEEYNELLEEMNKKEMLEKLDDMEMDNETLEKELDRTLELFKELEFEQKVEENINRLDDLQKEQKDLKEKTENKEKSAEELEKEQEKLNAEFDQLKKELEKMEELNEALENPKELPDLAQEKDQTDKSMNQAKDELGKKNEKKAGEQQKDAEEGMKKMSEKLSSFQKEQQSSQQSENLDDMRQLMENIVDLSINQEEILEGFREVKGNDPKYVEYAKAQKDLIDDTRVVEDSLLALSKRVPQIDRIINDEITEVKFSMDKALSLMTDQPPNQESKYNSLAAERQQYAMTALNNLALLFDEIIKQMQQEMAKSMEGTGQCEKPGNKSGGKPSASDMKKMQQNLNKQLEKLKEAKEKGKNPNGKKPGDQPGLGQSGMSKELARMAAQQSAIRKQLRQMSESLEGEKGGRAGDRMIEIERKMEETEEDILYDRIDAETMRRQEEILTQLLESEKAEREQELDKKRESKSAVSDYNIPDEVWESFEKERQKEIEFYKTMPPNLKPFYRNEVNRYFSGFPID